MEASIDFDIDYDEVADNVKDAVVEKLKYDDLFVEEDDLESKVGSVAESLLASLPVDRESRCSLGMTFTGAVEMLIDQHAQQREPEPGDIAAADVMNDHAAQLRAVNRRVDGMQGVLAKLALTFSEYFGTETDTDVVPQAMASFTISDGERTVEEIHVVKTADQQFTTIRFGVDSEGVPTNRVESEPMSTATEAMRQALRFAGWHDVTSEVTQ